MPPSKGNILLVDDTPANLQILSQILAKQGYKIRPAISGQLALKSIQLTLPDLILLDIKMPDMDGYQVCEKLKADDRTRDIPIIFISALSELFDKIKAFSLGGVDYITKPFQPEEVLTRVETHLKRHQLQQQLQTSQQELIQFEKLASLRQQIAGLAHEINKPLAAISEELGTINQIKNQYLAQLPDFLSSDFQRSLETIENASQRASQIVLALKKLIKFG